MVHRAIFGSLERFFAILLESVEGDLPLWLAPTQLRLLPVTDEARGFCADVAAKAKRRGLRCEVDPGRTIEQADPQTPSSSACRSCASSAKPLLSTEAFRACSRARRPGDDRRRCVRDAPWN